MLAARRRAALYGNNSAQSGDLIFYGSDSPNVRLAAGYIDRILEGAKPGEPPMNCRLSSSGAQPQDAKALGQTVPSTLLTAADEVIE